jgi:hydroxymethylglutaryl-CoA reductase
VVRGFRHHGANAVTAIFEATHQLEALIGRDTAADDQKDALGYRHGDPFQNAVD